MSISFPATESGSTLDRLRSEPGDATRTSSPARIEANRRNSRGSTGPRTVEGKRRSSRNAMKHGLCRTLSCLPSECEATFLTFVKELREELRPATAMQRIAFNQIASLTWRLERLPEAQTKLFAQELAKVEAVEEAGSGFEAAGSGAGETLSPSDVLARRFSDAPMSNGFALIERYERGMRSQLLRLMRQFEQLKKERTTTPIDSNEVFEARRAKYERQLRDDEERYAANRAQHAREEAERASKLAERTATVASDDEGGNAAKRTQSKPTEIDRKPPPRSVAEVSHGCAHFASDGTKPSAAGADVGSSAGFNSSRPVAAAAPCQHPAPDARLPQILAKRAKPALQTGKLRYE